MLNDRDRERYARQLMLPGFGEEEQARLRDATVLVTRCGGLGGPVAFWLAGAGVGRLILGHGSVLEPPDLNRMILMRGDGVGQPRAEQARETLLRFRPDLEVEAYSEDATEANVAEWVGKADVVCSTTPSFGERLLLNRECWRQGKPLVYSGMDGYEAQITTVIPPTTPCVACFAPEPPEWWSPVGFGVLAPVPGSLAGFTAHEAIKVLTGTGEPLAGRLLTYDCEDMTFSTFTLARRPDCPVCGGESRP